MASLTHPVTTVLSETEIRRGLVIRRRSSHRRFFVLLIGLLGVLLIAGIVLVATMGFTCG